MYFFDRRRHLLSLLLLICIQLKPTSAGAVATTTTTTTTNPILTTTTMSPLVVCAMHAIENEAGDCKSKFVTFYDSFMQSDALQSQCCSRSALVHCLDSTCGTFGGRYIIESFRHTILIERNLTLTVCERHWYNDYSSPFCLPPKLLGVVTFISFMFSCSGIYCCFKLCTHVRKCRRRQQDLRSRSTINTTTNTATAIPGPSASANASRLGYTELIELNNLRRSTESVNSKV